MHSREYARKMEERARMLNPDNADVWRERTMQVGKKLVDLMGQEKYEELVDTIPNGKSWKYFYEFLSAALNDDEPTYGRREQDWLGIQ